MSLAAILAEFDGFEFADCAGRRSLVRLLPGLSEQELKEFSLRVPLALSKEMEQVLALAQGLKLVRPGKGKGGEPDAFDSAIGSFVDFTGRLACGQVLEEIMPDGLSIASDECGNSWTVDLTASSPCWGPVLYVCHDPPVVVFHCQTLESFLLQIKGHLGARQQSPLAQTRDVLAPAIWSKNPSYLSRQDCLCSDDPQLRAFALELDDGYLVCDLRNASSGDGFAWGRFGADTILKRYDSKLLFACKRVMSDRRPWWKKLFGSAPDRA